MTHPGPSIPAGPPRRTLHVLFCCDPGYYPHLAVAARSLLLNNPGRQVEIHLIASARDPAAEARLEAGLAAFPGHRLHRYMFRVPAHWPTSFHITGEAYVRLLAPEILPATLARVLYLDADLLVLGDLAELWETDIGAYAFAAVPDPYGEWRRPALGMPASAAYVNSGVLLINLETWRREGLSARLIQYVESHPDKLAFHDQDALNAVLHGRVRLLPPEWNLQARTLRNAGRRRLRDAARLAAAARGPAILHFTSARKPWLAAMATPGKSLWRRYQRASAWPSPPRLRLSALPEFAVNHLLYMIGLEITWDQLLRTTLPGRALARLIRPGGQGHAARRLGHVK